MIQCELLSINFACENRDVPFSILIYGNSKIGKSDLKDMIRIHFAKVKKLDIDDSFVFTVTPTAKHWDNYKSHQHTLIMDDIAFLNPNSAPNGDPSVDNLIHVINGTPWMPPQASLDKKGKTPLRVKLVVATTNTEDLNAHYYFSCPSAVQRRFPYIIVPEVKPEYADEEGFLDSKKIENIDNEYPDWWTFTVKRVDPVRITGSKYGRSNDAADRKRLAKMTIIHKDIGQKEILDFLNESINHHESVINSMHETVVCMKNTKLCGTCFMPTKYCDCLQYGDDNGTIYSFDDVINLFHANMYSTLMMFLTFFISSFYYAVFSVSMFSLFGIIAWIPYYFGYFHAARDRIEYFFISRGMIYASGLSRRWIRLLGTRVQTSMATPRILGSIAGILATAVIISRIRKIFVGRAETQGGVISVGVKPKSKKNERENVWYKENYVLSPMEISPQSQSLKSYSPEEVMLKFGRNCVHLCMNKTRITRAICVSGQYYLVNKHSIPDFEEDLEIEVIHDSSKTQVNDNVVFKITKDQVSYDSKDDCALMYFPNIPPKRCILEYFGNTQLKSGGTATFMGRDRCGNIELKSVSNFTHRTNATFGELKFVGDAYDGEVVIPTKKGDCGSIYVVFTPLGPYIAGIHVMGDLNVAVAMKVTRKRLGLLLMEAGAIGTQSGWPTLSSKSAKRTLGDLSEKSVFRYIEEGTASVKGSFSKFKPPLKSRVEKTPINSYLKEQGYETKYTAPVMGGWTPWRIAAKDLVRPVHNLRYDILLECKQAFLHDILGCLPREELELLEVYNDFSAINGAPGIASVDRIPTKTSAGNPWKCSKQRFIKYIDHQIEDVPEPIEVDDEIMDRVRDIEAKYAEGEMAHPNFCAHLKDEPVTLEKAHLGKTRVFTGAPFDWTIVVRKYLLSLCRVLQDNHFAFEAAPGMNHASSQWGRLYKYLTQHCTNTIVAGDYKSFDKRMSPVAIQMAFDIIKSLCAASGNYTEMDLKMIEGIKMDTAFPLVDYNGDLVQFHGSNPSGHPLTVVINSLVNSLYIRYCYRVLNPQKEVSNFRANVNLMTYGDDNIMGVSPMIPWFNHTSISEVLASVEIIYTMADKKSTSVPYISIEDATFLNRKWVYNNEICNYMSPLNHDSIERSLMVWVRSKSVWRGEQIIDIISSACREYFYYGKEIFENKRIMFQDLLNYHHCSGCNPQLSPHNLVYHQTEKTLPEWEDLVESFGE